MTKLTFSDICENAAEEIGRLIEQGTAPWQQPLAPGASRYPINAKSGKPYQGMNYIWLAMQSQPDPRWVTYRQAAELGGQVRKGEKGQIIVFWRFDHKRAQRDAAGKILKDAAGESIWVKAEKPIPMVRTARVFNATQIDDLPTAAWETDPVPLDDLAQQADAWIAATGALSRNRRREEIQLPHEERDIRSTPETWPSLVPATPFGTLLPPTDLQWPQPPSGSLGNPHR